MSSIFGEDDEEERQAAGCKSQTWIHEQGEWNVHHCGRELGHPGKHACGDGYEWDRPTYPPAPSKANLHAAMRELIGKEFGSKGIPAPIGGRRKSHGN